MQRLGVDTEPDFKCDRCRKALAFDEVGYLGSQHPADESCTPFTRLLCLCWACAQADPRYAPKK